MPLCPKGRRDLNLGIVYTTTRLHLAFAYAWNPNVVIHLILTLDFISALLLTLEILFYHEIERPIGAGIINGTRSNTQANRDLGNDVFKLPVLAISRSVNTCGQLHGPSIFN